MSNKDETILCQLMSSNKKHFISYDAKCKLLIVVYQVNITSHTFIPLSLQHE